MGDAGGQGTWGAGWRDQSEVAGGPAHTKPCGSKAGVDFILNVLESPRSPLSRGMT